jgi:hypothetical protein
LTENNGILVRNSKEGKTTLITIKPSSAVRQAHGPEQSRRAALSSIAPPCGVLPHTPQSSLLDALHLAWILHELLSRDHEDGRATWQPQGVGSEAYLNGTSQGPTPEDGRKDDHIRGRSQ